MAFYLSLDWAAWSILSDESKADSSTHGLTVADLVYFAIGDKLNLYPERLGTGPEGRPGSPSVIPWMLPLEAGQPRQTHPLICALDLELFDKVASAAAKIGLTVEQYIGCAVVEKAVLYRQNRQPSTQLDAV